MQYLSRDGSYSLRSGCVARHSCCPHAVGRVNCRIAPLFGRRSHILMNTETTGTTLTSHHSLEADNKRRVFQFVCLCLLIPKQIDLCILTCVCNTWTVHSVARLLLFAVSATGRRRVAAVEVCELVVADAEPSSESDIINMIETRLGALRPAGPFAPDSIR